MKLPEKAAVAAAATSAKPGGGGAAHVLLYDYNVCRGSNTVSPRRKRCGGPRLSVARGVD